MLLINLSNVKAIILKPRIKYGLLKQTYCSVVLLPVLSLCSFSHITLISSSASIPFWGYHFEKWPMRGSKIKFEVIFFARFLCPNEWEKTVAPRIFEKSEFLGDPTQHITLLCRTIISLCFAAQQHITIFCYFYLFTSLLKGSSGVDDSSPRHLALLGYSVNISPGQKLSLHLFLSMAPYHASLGLPYLLLLAGFHFSDSAAPPSL